MLSLVSLAIFGTADAGCGVTLHESGMAMFNNFPSYRCSDWIRVEFRQPFIDQIDVFGPRGCGAVLDDGSGRTTTVWSHGRSRNNPQKYNYNRKRVQWYFILCSGSDLAVASAGHSGRRRLQELGLRELIAPETVEVADLSNQLTSSPEDAVDEGSRRRAVVQWKDWRNPNTHYACPARQPKHGRSCRSKQFTPVRRCQYKKICCPDKRRCVAAIRAECRGGRWTVSAYGRKAWRRRKKGRVCYITSASAGRRLDATVPELELNELIAPETDEEDEGSD